MIVITGAAGFIGSCLVQKLNNEGREDLILVDDFSDQNKARNLSGKRFLQKIERENFHQWLKENAINVSFVYHIGARTDTTEFDVSIFNHLNLDYTKSIWKICSQHRIPLVYASSAATYGAGELGYDDNHEIISKLKPLNPYGESKNDFDKWALLQPEAPPLWIGLKFFNVYGPNEYHKARMASVIFHAFNQIQKAGKVKLFRSHRAEYKDGWQLRDFVYVKDVVNVCWFFHQHQKHSGIYNLGSGKARSFYDLAANTFKAMNHEVQIDFIDIPQDIRDKYQYFTEANMQKLISIGYSKPFTTLEQGVNDYVTKYLLPNAYF